MPQTLKNIINLGIKELRGLYRDPLMLGLIAYFFTFALYDAASAATDPVSDAAIAVVDEDQSALSARIKGAFLPPMFLPVKEIPRHEIDSVLERGIFTFVLVIPTSFEKNVAAGHYPQIQLNIDATRMKQSFAGGGYISSIIQQETAKFFKKGDSRSAVEISIRNRFNPNREQVWQEVINTLINNIAMLAIILTGSAVIREREHGTLEHLLVMPVNAFEIMVSKIWSMSLVVFLASVLSMFGVIRWALAVPISGSLPLFFSGVLLTLVALTAIGILLATIADSMPQLGMLIILVLLPMQMLSGGSSPLESMPEFVQRIMFFSPTTQFTTFGSAILYRGAGLDIVWKEFVALGAISAGVFLISLSRFRKSIAA